MAQLVSGSEGCGSAGTDVKAVLLDAAGTLIRPREPVGETYAAVARRFGAALDPDMLSLSFIEVFGDMPDLAFDWTSMDDLRQQERDWWRTLVRRVIGLMGNRIGNFDGYFETLYAHYAQGHAWECSPDAPAALIDLRAKGCRLAVVSNFDSRLVEILKDLGIGDLIDAIVYSSMAGCAKPNPAIFHCALAALGVAPEWAIHVGDSQEADFGGAAAAGVKGLLIRPDGMQSNDSESEIQSLREIVARLGERD